MIPNRSGVERRQSVHERLARLLPSDLARWAAVLSRLRGRRHTDQMILYVSLIRSAVAWGLARLRGREFDGTTRALADATVVSRADGTIFHVRGGSDDLYSVLPGRERDVAHKILAPLREGDMFVDVGANVGGYALPAAKRVGPTGRVVAIEASPDNARVLQRAVATNGLENVTVHQVAVGAADADVVHLAVPPAHLGQVHVVRRDAAHGPNTVVVRGATLDALMDLPQRVRVLKVDVEGAELDVLRGAGRTLSTADSVVLEANDHAAELQAVLRRSGMETRELRFADHIWGWRSEAGLGPRRRRGR